MTVPAKLAGFAAVVAIAFGGAAAVGAAIGPEPAKEAQHTSAGSHGATAESTVSTDHGGPGAEGAEEASHPVRGLSVAEAGLRVVVGDPELRRGRVEELRFRVADEEGATVRDFEIAHGKRMHLILARRDLTGFQHLHPVQQADGSWAAEVRLVDAGSYRLFADFTRGGDPYTLASDLRVDGEADLRDLPTPALIADAGDGYEVRREASEARAGDGAELRFTVYNQGAPVRVEPYLGAGGHLVALREGDLAFLHVHPTEHAEQGGNDDSVGFEATFPTAGRYRLFLQFKHEGRVHTAAFTEEVR
ncbi:MAG: hypothetical protein WKF94_11565 [Solirubrobacteraceae bacterium]